MFTKDEKDMKVKCFDKDFAPKLYMTPQAMYKMATIIDECKDEVGWLGHIEELGSSDFLLTDVFLFEQEVNAVTCEITPEGLNDFTMELLEKDGGIDILNNIKLWGHSHVNMGVSPSGQDDSQLKEFAGDNKYYFRLIANKKGDMRVDYVDYEKNVMFEHIDFSIYYDLDYVGIEEQIKKEVKEKVKPKATSYVSSYNPPTSFGVYGSYGSTSGYNSKSTKSSTSYGSYTKSLDRAWDDGYNDGYYRCDMDLTGLTTEQQENYLAGYDMGASYADMGSANAFLAPDLLFDDLDNEVIKMLQVSNLSYEEMYEEVCNAYGEQYWTDKEKKAFYDDIMNIKF